MQITLFIWVVIYAKNNLVGLIAKFTKIELLAFNIIEIYKGVTFFHYYNAKMINLLKTQKYKKTFSQSHILKNIYYFETIINIYK